MTHPIPLDEFLLQQLNRPNLQIQVQHHDRQLQVFLRSTPVLQPSAATVVYKALKELNLQEVETIRVYGMKSKSQIAWRKEFSWSHLTKDDLDPYSFNNRYVAAFAFPIAITLGMVTNSGLFNIFFQFSQLWIHELGHATVAWLAGHRAIPLPIGVTPVAGERSLFVYFGVLFLLGLTIWTGWREQKRWVMGGAIAACLIQLYMTWIMPRDTFFMWLSFGGIGGEFYLSTLFMVSFHFPLPEKFRWEFWRYAVLLVSANCFWGNFWTWRQIRRGAEEIPWGSIFGGAGDSNGDMNQLNEVYNWSITKIVDTYNHLGNLCLFILIAVYLFTVIRQNRSWFKQFGVYWR